MTMDSGGTDNRSSSSSSNSSSRKAMFGTRSGKDVKLIMAARARLGTRSRTRTATSTVVTPAATATARAMTGLGGLLPRPRPSRTSRAPIGGMTTRRIGLTTRTAPGLTLIGPSRTSNPGTTTGSQAWTQGIGRALVGSARGITARTRALMVGATATARSCLPTDLQQVPKAGSRIEERKKMRKRKIMAIPPPTIVHTRGPGVTMGIGRKTQGQLHKVDFHPPRFQPHCLASQDNSIGHGLTRQPQPQSSSTRRSPMRLRLPSPFAW
mmetsp:Transcript_52772/g.115318  ORF Transcript_52772/g.115318 Transcript_52772/m.115318 type:complete len:267 (+) Transcript_52772:216-1016(+)